MGIKSWWGLVATIKDGGNQFCGIEIPAELAEIVIQIDSGIRASISESARQKRNGKISPEIRREIKTRWQAGETQQQIAKSLGISQASVSLIIREK